MCVILAVPESGKDIEATEMKAAFASNSNGYGVAWVDKGAVRYRKYASLNAYVLSTRPPKPYIMHFRLATVGGENTRLCHPFEINKVSQPRRKGVASSVLFHNGHIWQWQSIMEFLDLPKRKWPRGPFSDTRACAIAAAYKGPKILEQAAQLQGQRFAVLDSRGIMTLTGHWTLDKEDGVYRTSTWHTTPGYTPFRNGFPMGSRWNWEDVESGYHEPRDKVCPTCGVLLTTFEEPHDKCFACITKGANHLPVPRCRRCAKEMYLEESIKLGLCTWCRDTCDVCKEHSSKTTIGRDLKVYCHECVKFMNEWEVEHYAG